MVQLQDLPKELRDAIAEELGNGSKPLTAYNALSSLSLTSQQLRQSAQEVMYRNITIGTSKYDFVDHDYPYVQGWSRLGCLVRTLLERPDLAQSVRKLDISITTRIIGHESQCLYNKDSCPVDFCVCDWDDLCANFLKMVPFFTGPGFNDTEWMERIHSGEQLAVLGVVLACTPLLQSLAIDSWTNTYLNVYFGEPKPIVFHEMFGNISSANGFSMSWISGLANLRSFAVNCLLSPELVTLPNVRFLKFGLEDRTTPRTPKAIRLPSSISTDSAASPLKRLRISLDAGCLCHSKHLKEYDIYGYMQQLPERLPNLNHLELSINPFVSFKDWTRDISDGSYDCLVAKLTCYNIEILILDTSSVAEELIERGRNHNLHWDMRWVQKLERVESLTNFSKLRKIVAAQEAFFSMDETFAVCELPSSIEEILIVDTTCTLHRWLKHILVNLWKYPNLKVITAWWIQYHWDRRLGNESDFPYEDVKSAAERFEIQEVEDEEEEQGADLIVGGEDEGVEPESYGSPEDNDPPQWKKDFVAAWRDDSILSDLKSAGVDVRQEYRYDSNWDSALGAVL